MILFEMPRLFLKKMTFINLFLISFFYSPIEAKEISFSTDVTIGKIKNSISHKEIYSNLKLEYQHSNISTALKINNSKTDNIFYDGSFINYKIGILDFGLGTISRNWSFSPNNSLILSQNSRPLKSIYFKLHSKDDADETNGWSPLWTFEIFNGWNNANKGPNNAMFIGTRATVQPIQRLNLEFIRTTQWGGSGNSKGVVGLKNALIGNTNEGRHANINHMAGIGFSFQPSNRKPGFRIYGQAIGEDEANYLPNCFIHLFGFEWSSTLSNMPLIIGLERIDTRVNKTSNGNCGKNTAYNNNIYPYTNYETVMGAYIDTEGTATELNTTLQIKKDMGIKYSLKEITINDTDWLNHRLSSTRKFGLVNSVSLNIEKNRFNTKLKFSHQNFGLDRAKIKKGLRISLSTSFLF
jgi:hypothetical protein